MVELREGLPLGICMHIKGMAKLKDMNINYSFLHWKQIFKKGKRKTSKNETPIPWFVTPVAVRNSQHQIKWLIQYLVSKADTERVYSPHVHWTQDSTGLCLLFQSYPLYSPKYPDLTILIIIMLPCIEDLPWGRPWASCRPWAFVLLSPFHSWESWASERSSNLPKVIHLCWEL